ncbi:putative membrane protein [Paraburkholderia sp. GAS334]
MKNYIFKVGVSIEVDDQDHRIVYLTAEGLVHLTAAATRLSKKTATFFMAICGFTRWQTLLLM